MPDVSVDVVLQDVEFPALFEVHQRHVGGQEATQEEKSVNYEVAIQKWRGEKLLS